MLKIKSLGASLLAICAGGPALAQETTNVEIVVTATKREQTLQDVPVSVAVVGTQEIERAQVRDLIDLQTAVPSLRVTQTTTAGYTNFYIRGFGNGIGNYGVENSVGVFVDGVYRSRSGAALDDLPEVSRIEVLRGPQSTLFGKNVSAGVVSVVTQQPEFEFGGMAELSVGNYDMRQVRGSITGPITDDLAFRVSGSHNVRDGYIENEVTGNDLNDRDRWSLRADFLYRPTDDFSVRVIGDYNTIDEVCCGSVQVHNTQSGANAIMNFLSGGGVDNYGGSGTLFDDRNATDVDPTNHLIGRGLSAQVDWNLGFANLTSISAYRKQSVDSHEDVDFTGADVSFKDQTARIDTFTQEIRLASNGDGPLHWLVGAFYQDESLDTGVDTQFGSQARTFANIASGGGVGAYEGFIGAAPGTFFAPGQGIHDFYSMDQTFWSVFGQVDYDVTDRLTLTAGLAHLSDRKEVVSDVVLTDLFSQQTFAGPFAGLNALQFFYGNTTNHGPVNYPNASESGELEDSATTYSLRAAYEFDLFNAYLSYSTGWKAGAFNLSSDARPGNRTAEPEDVQVIEAGLKTRFNGGYLNLAVFQQTIENFQVNNYTGTGFVLQNAEEQRVRGVEIESAYSPLDWLQLTGAVTYLDAEYISYDDAPCLGPAAGFNCTPPTQDLSGETPSGIPEWALSTSATVTHDFNNGFNGYIRAEYDWSSERSVSELAPDRYDTYGTENVNLSVGLVNEPQQIELSLWTRNLTDDRYIVAAFPTVAQTGSYTGFANQPRTYGVTLRKRF